MKVFCYINKPEIAYSLSISNMGEYQIKDSQSRITLCQEESPEKRTSSREEGLSCFRVSE